MKIPWIIAPLLLSIAACGGGDQASVDHSPTTNRLGPDDVVPTPVLPGDSRSVGAPDEMPTPEPSGNVTGTDAGQATVADTIPVALRGRWGLVSADCISTKGDNKGLITISANDVRFYEAVATLDKIAESDPSRIVADFGFEGEGQRWQKRMLLDEQDGGKTLIRREYGADAMPGPLKYSRCAA